MLVFMDTPTAFKALSALSLECLTSPSSRLGLSSGLSLGIASSKELSLKLHAQLGALVWISTTPQIEFVCPPPAFPLAQV